MTQIELRDPKQVMRLARLGSFHQSRLSFMRILTRRMARENWRFERTEFDINPQGVGYAVYTAHAPEQSYSLVAFAHDLPPEQRSDRVIAEAWDATFTLFDGIPTEDDITRLAQNVPRQEAGRVSETELSLARANRSVRLWEHVVSALAAGQQPDPAQIDAVGYLMRTTAVYGSGKFGAADREMTNNRPEFRAPFQVEMLSVYLIRWFVTDLVQHMADARANGKAAQLDPQLARCLGIGNSTGLGMAPFLLNHPQLINNWIAARERALQSVRQVRVATDAEITLFHELRARAEQTVLSWHSEHPVQIEKIAHLTCDLAELEAHLSQTDLCKENAWDSLYRWAEGALSTEGQEWLVSLMLEPYGALVDDEADQMAQLVDDHAIDGVMRVAELRSLLKELYDWALAIDWSQPEARARAWYVSEEKLEPRLGERFEEPIEPYEQPLAPGRDAAALFETLADWPDEAEVAELLLAHPEHRHILRRVQIVARAPYAEIHDNTISAEVLPIDMLRCKLSFFGATQFDPRSDRWVRICMYAGAPLPSELSAETSDFWIYPEAAAT